MMEESRLLVEQAEAESHKAGLNAPPLRKKKTIAEPTSAQVQKNFEARLTSLQAAAVF